MDIGFEVVDDAGRPVANHGRRAAGDLDQNVPAPGEYFVYLDNTYSFFTPKTVTVTLCTYR